MGLDLFNNPIIKNAAFGQLRKMCKSEGVKMVVIEYHEEKDDFEFKLIKDESCIVTKTEFDEMKEVYLKQVNQ